MPSRKNGLVLRCNKRKTKNIKGVAILQDFCSDHCIELCSFTVSKSVTVRRETYFQYLVGCEMSINLYLTSNNHLLRISS